MFFLKMANKHTIIMPFLCAGQKAASLVYVGQKPPY